MKTETSNNNGTPPDDKANVSGSGVTLNFIEEHKSVKIYYVPECNHYEFTVPKGQYIKATLERCKDRIDYLVELGENVV